MSETINVSGTHSIIGRFMGWYLQMHWDLNSKVDSNIYYAYTLDILLLLRNKSDEN